jgi:hypothetical protein
MTRGSQAQDGRRGGLNVVAMDRPYGVRSLVSVRPHVTMLLGLSNTRPSAGRFDPGRG